VESYADLELAEQEVLKTARQKGRLAPGTLIADLTSRCGFSDEVTREAIWDLIDQNLLRLAADRTLRSVEPRQDTLAP
jgi:hypothetical protein